MSARFTLDKIRREIAERKAMHAKRLQSKQEFKEALEAAREKGRKARLEAELSTLKKESMVLSGRADLVKQINKEKASIARDESLIRSSAPPSLTQRAFAVGKKINRSIEDFDKAIKKHNKRPRLKF